MAKIFDNINHVPFYNTFPQVTTRTKKDVTVYRNLLDEVETKKRKAVRNGRGIENIEDSYVKINQVQDYLEQLKQEIDLLDFRMEKRVQKYKENLERGIAALRKELKFFHESDSQGYELFRMGFEVDNVTIEETYIGDIQVCYEWYAPQLRYIVKIINKNNQRIHYDHPHVDNNKPCFGNISQLIINLLIRGHLDETIEPIKEWLYCYNPGSPFCTLNVWDIPVGALCEICRRHKKMCMCNR